MDYSSNRTGSSDNIRDIVFEPRVLAGYDFYFDERTVYTVYLGFGYRYLKDDGSGKVSTTGALGYQRESNYYYTPVGVEGLADVGNNWFIEAIAEYDFLWSGSQISHLGDAIPGWNTVSDDQNTGWGVRGSLKVLKKSERYDWSFGPFFRYWRIEKSEDSHLQAGGTLIGFAWEPENNSTEIGANASLMF